MGVGEGEQEGKRGKRRNREKKKKDKGVMNDKREGRKIDEQGKWKEK